MGELADGHMTKPIPPMPLSPQTGRVDAVAIDLGAGVAVELVFPDRAGEDVGLTGKRPGDARGP
jgi:hypothetical protein